MRNWLLKLKCDVKKQNHPTVSKTLKKIRKVRNVFGRMLFSCMVELAKQ